jgi:hypothetical protein
VPAKNEKFHFMWACLGGAAFSFHCHMKSRAGQMNHPPAERWLMKGGVALRREIGQVGYKSRISSSISIGSMTFHRA